MRNFNNDRGGFRNFSDRGGFGGQNRQRSFGGNRNTDRQMYDTVCDKCGQDCQVPFLPTGEKPVYCSNCFEKTSGRDGGNRDFNRGGKRFEARDTKDYQHDNTRLEIEEISKKLDKILDILAFQNKTPKATEKTSKENKKKKVKKAEKKN